MLETYSTTNVRRGSKVAYWNDLHCRMLFPLEVAPADPAKFDADFSVAGVADTLLVKIASLPASIERTARHVSASGEQRFTLLMPLLGTIHLSHHGRDVVLEEGDFTLCDSSAPSRLSYIGANQSLAMTAPTTLLRSYLPLPESVCGLRISGTAGIGRLLPSLLRGLWDEAVDGLPAELGHTLVTTLLHVAATSYALEHKGTINDSAVRGARKAQIKRLIETHLRSPDLSVRTIADSIGLSTRYVHKVFADEGESILAYILRRRLEECALQLQNPLWLGHTATKIAFECGFGSSAHFSRAFKARYGVSPNAFRHSGQQL